MSSAWRCFLHLTDNIAEAMQGPTDRNISTLDIDEDHHLAAEKGCTVQAGDSGGRKPPEAAKPFTGFLGQSGEAFEPAAQVAAHGGEFLYERIHFEFDVRAAT